MRVNMRQKTEWTSFIGEALSLTEAGEDRVRRLKHIRRDLLDDQELDCDEARVLLARINAALAEHDS
jgi:hypothetical protein